MAELQPKYQLAWWVYSVTLLVFIHPIYPANYKSLLHCFYCCCHTRIGATPAPPSPLSRLSTWLSHVPVHGVLPHPVTVLVPFFNETPTSVVWPLKPIILKSSFVWNQTIFAGVMAMTMKFSWKSINLVRSGIPCNYLNSRCLEFLGV